LNGLKDSLAKENKKKGLHLLQDECWPRYMLGASRLDIGGRIRNPKSLYTACAHWCIVHDDQVAHLIIEGNSLVYFVKVESKVGWSCNSFHEQDDADSQARC